MMLLLFGVVDVVVVDVLNSGISPTHWPSPAQTRAFKTTRFGSYACPVSASGFVPLVPALGLCDQVFRWESAWWCGGVVPGLFE